jgi:dCTP diphosphatase
MSNKDSLINIDRIIQKFSKDRDWDQFHTPKNLIMAATSEIGELSEVLQWKSDEEVIAYLKTEQGRTKLSEEIADVAIYLIRLCQKTEINFIDAIQNKLNLNEEKYPVDTSKGSAKKYSEH